MASRTMTKLLKEAIRNGIRESLKNRFKERRNRLEIMEDILRATRNGARKTEIMHKANLNFTRVNNYISFLTERGLLDNTGPIYTITEKGEEFLRDYDKIKDLIPGSLSNRR